MRTNRRKGLVQPWEKKAGRDLIATSSCLLGSHRKDRATFATEVHNGRTIDSGKYRRIQLDTREKNSQTPEQVPQRGCAGFILGGCQDLTGASSEDPGLMSERLGPALGKRLDHRPPKGPFSWATLGLYVTTYLTVGPWAVMAEELGMQKLALYLTAACEKCEQTFS